MQESMLKTLKELAAKTQPLKGQSKVYDTMYRKIIPMALEVPGNFLEIGVFLGKTTIFLAEYLRLNGSKRILITIDPLDEEHNNCKKNKVKDVRKHFLDHTGYLTNHIHNFNTSEDGVRLVEDNSVAFAFIDGDHTKEGVIRDFYLYFPKMKVGGIMCFDDYKNGKWKGVGLALKQVAYKNPKLELVYEGKKEVYFKKIKE